MYKNTHKGKEATLCCHAKQEQRERQKVTVVPIKLAKKNTTTNQNTTVSCLKTY